MKRFIFGFQRRVWWPKWTPASSSSFMETTGMGAPFMVGVAFAGGARASAGLERLATVHGGCPAGWEGQNVRIVAVPVAKTGPGAFLGRVRAVYGSFDRGI